MAGLTSTEVKGAVELIRRIRDNGRHAADRRAHHGGHHAHRRQGRGARRRRQDRRGRPDQDHRRRARDLRLPGRQVQPPPAGPEGGAHRCLSRS
ncbi:MAG: hypothetical protein MZV64_09610 [Ignavibacteriales bacterium]|nr:hypothetical protein [Ignavibacteriales bacterium]